MWLIIFGVSQMLIIFLCTLVHQSKNMVKSSGKSHLWSVLFIIFEILFILVGPYFYVPLTMLLFHCYCIGFSFFFCIVTMF